MDGVRYPVPSHLELTCHKCTKHQKIRGASEEEANRRAELMGWRQTERGMVCRNCPGGGVLDLDGLELEYREEMRRANEAAHRY